MKQNFRFLIIWFVNSCLILIANSFLPTKYVLGNAVMMPIIAGLVTGFLLTIFCLFMKTFSNKFAGKKYKIFAYYYLTNVIGIWVLARMSVITGFGIPSYTWAIYLAVFTTGFQWITRQLIKKVKLF